MLRKIVDTGLLMLKGGSKGGKDEINEDEFQKTQTELLSRKKRKKKRQT